jgi:protein-disulfide isomerase
MDVRVHALAAVGNLITVTATVLTGVFSVADQVGWILLVVWGDRVEEGKIVPSTAALVRVWGCILLVMEGCGVPSSQSRVGVVVLIRTVLTCGVFPTGCVREHAIITRKRNARMNRTLRDGRFECRTGLDFNRRSILYVHYNDFHNNLNAMDKSCSEFQKTCTWYNLAMQPDFPPNDEPIQTNTESKARNDTWLYYLLVGLTLAAGLALGYLMWGRQNVILQQSSSQDLVWQALQKDGPALGPADAPVTIVEFSDFECPFCVRWHQEVWPQISDAYQGKVRLVYRDFPLIQAHPYAQDAAIAARCAGEQDRYWDYHNLLFQGEMELSPLTFDTYSSRLELEQETFKTCLENPEMLLLVQNDLSLGEMIGIDGTPTFFINGYRIKGAQPFEEFQKVIDSILTGQE